MSGSDHGCAEITLRLVAGETPSGDPTLARHVGSCLRCFRTASEMRELPQIARLMRQAEHPTPDPGEAFWAQFPAAVAGAWMRQRSRSDRFANRFARTLQWMRGWLRLPVPAALAGAAATALLMVLAVGHRAGPEGSVGVAAVVDGPGQAQAQVQGQLLLDDEMTPANVPVLLGDEDPWSLLELADLKWVVAKGDRDRDAAASALDDLSDGTPTPAEEVGLLDTEDPPAVEQTLETRSRI
jgi:hypothetical protein